MYSAHGSSPAAARLADAASPLDRAIQRLEEVVDQETAALRTRAAIDLREFNNRKSQGLLDLNKALRVIDNLAADRGVAARLAQLRAKLDTNRAVLKMHLEAVREISTIVADTIRNADSDGTYSRSITMAGYRE
jgi:flagellar biosynthesis/type III secretory pathway chaperone